MGGGGGTRKQTKITMEISYLCFSPQLWGFYSGAGNAEEMFQLSFKNIAAAKLSRRILQRLTGAESGEGGLHPGHADAGREEKASGNGGPHSAAPDPEQREVAPVCIRVLYIERFTADFSGSRMLSICPREYR